jgi:hypothetical protein
MTNLIQDLPTGPALLPPTRLASGRSTRTPVGVRGFWSAFAALLILPALVWGPYQVVTLLAHEQRVESQSFPAVGVVRLEINGASGSIQIEASERDTIEVRAEISDGLRKTGESRKVVGDTLQLHSTCPNFGTNFCSVNYRVQVPRDIALDLNSDNGSIRLSNVSGPLKLSMDNGRVEGTQLRSAAVTTDTDNGSVRLEFAAAPTMVTATADNGDVEIVVPNDGAAYNVATHTDNGSETVEVPRDSASSHTVSIRTDNGSASVRVS